MLGLSLIAAFVVRLGSSSLRAKTIFYPEFGFMGQVATLEVGLHLKDDVILNEYLVPFG